MLREIVSSASDDIQALCHPALVALARHWQSLHREGALPRRRDIRPAEIVAAMPYVALIDVVTHEPLVMTFRLVGTELVRWLGHDHTGRSVEDAYAMDVGPGWHRVVPEYARAVRDRSPARRFHAGSRSNGLSFRYERILLPLSSDGSTVDGLLMGLVPA